ncbi:MAG TPA: hypothetical protein VGL91_12390 [Acidobacteriota bacterium]|jgi:metal-responsive CopG/Arc/MetJ family transcriptional regulator
MKTAISIPDPIFEEAEELARRLGMSRSELYTKAVRRFVGKRRREGVTEILNRVYSEESSNLDPILAKLQHASLRRKEW